MPEEAQKQEPRQRGPNKIDVLEKEVIFLKTLILGIANYTGNDTLMAQLGVPHADLHKIGVKDMKRR